MIEIVPGTADTEIAATKKPIKLVIPPYGIYIGESHHERGFVMKPMCNYFTKIYYIIDGAADFFLEKDKVTLQREDLCVIPRSVEHYLEDKDNSPLSLYILAIRNSSLAVLDTFREELDLLNQLANEYRRPLSSHDYGPYEIPRMIRKILYEQRFKAAGYIPSIQATVLNMLVAINRIYKNIPISRQIEENMPTCTRIQQVAKFIDANFYEPIAVESMARMACLSVRQFTNQFKAIHGVTFMQYLHFQRVRYAMKLLAETDQQIMSICFASGFNDLTHFYRVFKRITGVSPRRYRLNTRASFVKAQKH